MIVAIVCALMFLFFQINSSSFIENDGQSVANVRFGNKWHCNYLVTGGAGFIGSHLVDKLLVRWNRDKPCRVIVLDNFNSYYSPVLKQRNIRQLKTRHSARVRDKSFIVIRGDIGDKSLLKRIFSEFQITHVAHLAALPGVRLSMKYVSNYTKTNIDGTQCLLEQSALNNISIFVFASTSSVYGRTQNVPFVETDPCDRPLSPYAATKRAAEILAHVYSNVYKLNVTILRLFNVYGPRGRPDMMPAQLLLASADCRRKINIFDNGTIIRDWTFVDDVVSGFLKALDKPLGYEIFNIGYGNPVSISVFIDYIERLSQNSNIRKNIRFTKSYITEPSITFANIDKAKRLLGFVPLTPLTSGLRKTWIWFKNEQRPFQE